MATESPPLITEADVLRFIRGFVSWLRGPAATSVKLDELAVKIDHQLTEIKMAIDDATTKAAADAAKVDQLVTEVHGLRDRVTAADAAKDAALAAANSAKDAATTALQAAQDEIAALKAAAVAVPADTSALEAALDSLGAKLDAAKAEVAAIDAAPAPTDGGGDTGPTASTEAPPVQPDQA